MGPIKVRFLGTGTSQGIPMIGCTCTVCQSSDTRDKRLRVSVFLEALGKNIIIDTGPDFRQQVLEAGFSQLDAILYTHEHKDHIAGMDDVRGFNFVMKRSIPIYGMPRVLNQIKKEFYYAFEENKYPGVPEVEPIEINARAFYLGDLRIQPIPVKHYQLDILGYRIGDFTYITDANAIPETSMDLIRGSKVLVLNALRTTPHISHFTLDQALDIIAEIQPEQAYLTHLSHQMGLHAQVQAELPKGVYLAYDGLNLTLP